MMNSATEYQSVPQQQEHDETDLAVQPPPASLFGFFLFVAIALPLIIFGALQYNNANKFSAETSYCRVNTIGTNRITHTAGIGSSVSAIWNVDVVKKPQDDTAAKDVAVLRPNLKTKPYGDYRYSSLALEDAEQRYSVSC